MTARRAHRNPQPLDPAMVRVIEELARAQARREYRRNQAVVETDRQPENEAAE